MINKSKQNEKAIMKFIALYIDFKKKLVKKHSLFPFHGSVLMQTLGNTRLNRR